MSDRHRRTGRTTKQLKTIEGTERVYIVHNYGMKKYCIRLNPKVQQRQIIVLMEENIADRLAGKALSEIEVDHALHYCATGDDYDALMKVLLSLPQ